MKKFTADYLNRDGYSHSICTADTIEELYQILRDRDFKYVDYSFYDALKWEKTEDKKFHSMWIEIRRGEPEMTEYTSL